MKVKGLFLVTLLLSACGGTSEANHLALPNKGTINNEDISIFPLGKGGIVGDAMPYFDGEYMNYFYLLEEDVKSAFGFHPWALIRTKDFLTYEDEGVVIPFVNDPGHQDMALGTGSVVRDEKGYYHAFYTGYNGTGNMPYFEKIQHATSLDLINWTKQPENGFYGGHNDFRDPYVFYNEEAQIYWMLITTRENNHGVIKLYTSTNLVNWDYDSILFSNDDGSYNMECPTLIKFGEYWYLTYSEQGSFRVTHYRYTKDLSSGNWIRPSIDYFDGEGVYAARLEKAWDKLYFVGWQAKKQHEYDGGDFDWGGNFVTHELVQLTNGELRAKPVEQILNKVNNEVKYEVVETSPALETKENSYYFKSNEYNYVLFEELEEKPTKMTFSINSQYAGKGGISFAHSESSSEGATNILFNLDEGRLEFYNVKTSELTNSKPQAYVPLTGKDGLNITVLTEDECLSVYVAGEQVLSTRMYRKSGRPFGLFSLESEIEFTNVRFFE